MRTPGNRPDDAPLDVRRAAFTREFRHLLDAVRRDRGWSVNRIATETRAVGKSALYRWRDGDWSQGEPSAGSVAKLYNSLGYDPDPALRALGVLRPQPGLPPPPTNDPLVERHIADLLRQLRDPLVSDARKVIIRATLAELASGGSDEARNQSAG